jgi:hypothetical protein
MNRPSALPSELITTGNWLTPYYNEARGAHLRIVRAYNPSLRLCAFGGDT